MQIKEKYLSLIHILFRGAAETEEKLKAAVEAGRGKDCDGEFTAELMGWMCERCGQVSIGNEWICADPYVQQDHAADPFDAFTRPVTNQSIYYFTQMMSCIVGDQWAEQVPKELPFYNIGGDQDPVGEYGKGIYEVSNWLCETGHQVKTKDVYKRQDQSGRGSVGRAAGRNGNYSGW